MRDAVQHAAAIEDRLLTRPSPGVPLDMRSLEEQRDEFRDAIDDQLPWLVAGANMVLLVVLISLAAVAALAAAPLDVASAAALVGYLLIELVVVGSGSWTTAARASVCRNA